MAKLLSDNDKAVFTKVLSDHFDTFQREITVHKEPTKIINTINSNKTYAGYNDSSNVDNFIFKPNFQKFPAIVVYDNKQAEIASQVATYPAGIVKIKVGQIARDYIMSGKTERIDVDGNSFNAITEDKIQNYLGLVFYIFYLRATS